MILLSTQNNNVYKFISNLNLPIIISIIALILSALSIYFNYSNSLKSMIFSKKIAIYTNYLQTISEAAMDKPIISLDTKHNHLADKSNLLLLGNKKIIQAATKIEPIDIDSIDSKEYRELITAMRKDLNKYDKTELNDTTIDDFINP
ncbi:MAG: hypothetical protein DUD32_04745 [Lactobacillus sp.]|nr:MAG: hypothetical protein DUD32_04745 [Lactobacillus sp.]